MPVYLIRFDGQDRPVEARSMTAAIAAWKRAMETEWGEDFDGTEEPEACQLVSDEAVIHDAPIVCLCGSTRFFETFQEASLRETVAGKIILSIGCNLRSDHQLWANPFEREAIKRSLDELHLRKIDLADEVLVLNVGGYIGDSTRREIAYAESLGRPVRYLEPQETTSHSPSTTSS